MEKLSLCFFNYAIGLKTFQRINLDYIYTVSWLFYTYLGG